MDTHSIFDQVAGAIKQMLRARFTPSTGATHSALSPRAYAVPCHLSPIGPGRGADCPRHSRGFPAPESAPLAYPAISPGGERRPQFTKLGGDP